MLINKKPLITVSYTHLVDYTCIYKIVWHTEKILIKKVVLVVIITNRINTVAHHYRKIIPISAFKLHSSSDKKKKICRGRNSVNSV